MLVKQDCFESGRQISGLFSQKLSGVVFRLCKYCSIGDISILLDPSGIFGRGLTTYRNIRRFIYYTNWAKKTESDTNRAKKTELQKH